MIRFIYVFFLCQLLSATTAFLTTSKSRDIQRHHQATASHFAFDQDFEKAWKPAGNGMFYPKFRKPEPSKFGVIHEVNDIHEYKKVVAQEKDAIVCVRFYAPWCRACKAVAPAFRRLPNQFPNVKFVEVPLTKDNAVLHQGLGVPSLPFAHIYHPEAGLVEEEKIGKNNFNRFRDETLQSYVDGFCAIPDKQDE